MHFLFWNKQYHLLSWWKKWELAFSHTEWRRPCARCMHWGFFQRCRSVRRFPILGRKHPRVESHIPDCFMIIKTIYACAPDLGVLKQVSFYSWDDVSNPKYVQKKQLLTPPCSMLKITRNTFPRLQRDQLRASSQEGWEMAPRGHQS